MGHGSIGARHARILEGVVDEVAVVSSRAVDHPRTFKTVEEMIEGFGPDYVVVANRTSEHVGAVSRLRSVGFRGRILVEKPFARSLTEAAEAVDPGDVRVAYNLRYHPVLKRLRELVGDSEVLLLRIDVGQYLPSWRPGSDYAASYSASRAGGGGVLRDLSHELDFLMWIFGDWRCLVADGGRVGALEIETEDYFAALLELDSGARANLHLNYLDRVPRRTVTVTTSSRTLIADLVAGTLTHGGSVKSFEVDRDATYRSQHEDCLLPMPEVACTLQEALGVLELVDSLERSVLTRGWIRQ